MTNVEVYGQLRKDVESAGITHGTLYFPEEKAVASAAKFTIAFRNGYEIKTLPETPEFKGRVGIKFNKLEKGVQN